MKIKRLFAVVLTALFLAPFFPARAETAPAFEIDVNTVLRGMDRSWLQGYAPTAEGGRWTMILPVRSDAAVGQITAELALPEGRVAPFKDGKRTVSARMEAQGIWGVRFALELLSDPKNADYPCVIRLSGKDRDGKALSAEIPYVIRMRGAKESLEKPRIEITDVGAELSVGEDGEISMTLANPCGAAILEDLELKISDGAGQILPRGADTLKIGTLGIGERVTAAYPVTVTEKAEVAPHVLKLEIGWTALGQEGSYTANYTLAVRQEIRLEQGGLKMAPAVAAGDSVSLSLPLMNMGKADVVNVLATVSLPGITERQSVLVGTIQPGETKQAQLILSPAKDITGDFSGTLAVECTDRDGNPASFWLPVNLTVEQPVKAAAEQAAGGESAQTEKPAALIWALAGGCGMMMAMLLTQGVVLRKKMHRLEEERL